MPSPLRLARRRPTCSRGRAWLRSGAVGLLVGLAVLLPGAGRAWAHAELTSTDPAPNAVLATAPSQVVLSFTEAVSVETDGVRILDASGERRDAGTASSTGTTVTVPVEGTLDRGGYVVAWRVVSADGHPISGAFQFSVGIRTQVDEAVVDDAFGAGSDRRDEMVGNIARGVAYICALVAAGATFVGARLRRPDEASPVNRWVALLTAVGTVAILVQVPVQTSRMTGRGWGSVTEAGVLGRALGDGFGWAIAISVLGLVLIGITAGLPFRGPVPVLAVAGSVLAPIGFAVHGHTRTMSPAALAYLSDAVHLVVAAVWFGGLVALVVTVRRRRAEGDVVGAATAVAAFSGIAGVALLLVATTGATMSWIEVRSVDALTSTTYGKLLMAKVALVGLVALGGTWNRFRLVPHLTGGSRAETDGRGAVDADGDRATEAAPAGDPEPDRVEGSGVDAPPGDDPRWANLARVLRFEVALLVAAVGVTGILVNETPARQALVRDISAQTTFGEDTLRVQIDSDRRGAQDIHAYILEPDGSLADYEAVEIELSLPAQDIGPIDAEPVRVSPGHFQVVGADLTIAGQWSVTVTARPDRFTLVEGTVDFTVR